MGAIKGLDKKWDIFGIVVLDFGCFCEVYR